MSSVEDMRIKVREGLARGWYAYVNGFLWQAFLREDSQTYRQELLQETQAHKEHLDHWNTLSKDTVTT